VSVLEFSKKPKVLDFEFYFVLIFHFLLIAEEYNQYGGSQMGVNLLEGLSWLNKCFNLAQASPTACYVIPITRIPPPTSACPDARLREVGVWLLMTSLMDDLVGLSWWFLRGSIGGKK
jgi:hypothetical protein